MVLQKIENEIKTMLADTILAMCSSTLDCNSEICVEGMLGVTIDKSEVILVQVNKKMKKGKGKHKVFSSHTPKIQKSTMSDLEDDLPNISGKRKRKMTWKMRESISASPGGGVDHAYTSATGQTPEKNRKKKRKTTNPSPGELVPLTSSDSEDNDPGFDDTGNNDDFETSRDDLNLSQPTANTTMTSGNKENMNGQGNDPQPSTSHAHDDPDLISGLSVVNLEQQLNSTAEDVLQGAQEVVGEVVETEDGQLVIKLGEMQPPLVNPQGIPYDAGQTSGTVQYRMIKGGTAMGRDMLTDSIGYSYAIRYSRDFGAKKDLKRNAKGTSPATYWRCTVRASRQQRLNGGITCTAGVTQRNGIFKRGETPHNHPPKEDLHARVLIGKMVREKARMLENLSIPSSHIFHEAVMSVIADDPTVSYESIAKYKSLFERRFNRARKECISSKTKIPSIGIRHLVRATQQHIREEKKIMKGQQQLQEQQNVVEDGQQQQQQQQQQLVITEHLHEQQQLQIQQNQQHLQGQEQHLQQHLQEQQQHIQLQEVAQTQHVQINNQRVHIIVSNT